MTFEAILHDHLARYPSMQIQDLYKLVHQAALGSEHTGSDPVAARQWLERELAELTPGYNEPALDPISGDGQILRVHLHPFVAQGGKPVSLLNAFLRTANEYRGDLKILDEYWDVAAAIAYFPAVELSAFIRSMREQAFPAVHHSPEYNRLYRPAYRVVCADFLA